MATSDEDKSKDEAEDRDDEPEGSGGEESGEEGGEDEAAEEEKPAAKASSAKPAKVATGKPARPRARRRRPGSASPCRCSCWSWAASRRRCSCSAASAAAARRRPPSGTRARRSTSTSPSSTDRTDLACASGTEIKGLHCAYESQSKKWSKGDPADEKKTLRPDSTTTSINMLAAGVWSEAVVAPDKVPSSRFTLKCKFNVAGKMPRADVRWHEGEGWNNVTDWYTGTVSDCKMGPIQN